MIILKIDDATPLKDLGLFVEPVEIHDPSGKLIGLFVPADLQRGKDLYARAAAMTDRAEIERRTRLSGQEVLMEEVRGRLHKLEVELERRKTAGEKEWTTEETMTYYRSLRLPASGSPEVEHANGSVEASRCVTT